MRKEVGMSGPLKQKRAKVMAQSNNFFSRGCRASLRAPNEVITVEVPKMKRFLEERKTEKDNELVPLPAKEE